MPENVLRLVDTAGMTIRLQKMPGGKILLETWKDVNHVDAQSHLYQRRGRQLSHALSPAEVSRLVEFMKQPPGAPT